MHLIHLTINKEVISTTKNHPFYVLGKGFTEAGEIQPGDQVINAAGEPFVVEEKRIEFVKEPVRVYNFQVEEFHTYHVGELGVLVHNADYAPEGVSGVKNPNFQMQKVFDVADDYKLSDDVYNGHIVERHGTGGSSFPNKSKFNSDFDIKKGIDDALRSDKSIVKPNASGREGSIFEHTFDKPIGTNPKGKPINTIKVVIDESGNVVTVFPKK